MFFVSKEGLYFHIKLLRLAKPLLLKMRTLHRVDDGGLIKGPLEPLEHQAIAYRGV